MKRFTRDELELIFAAIRKYQQANSEDKKLYQKCYQLLDRLYDSTYTKQVQ